MSWWLQLLLATNAVMLGVCVRQRRRQEHERREREQRQWSRLDDVEARHAYLRWRIAQQREHSSERDDD
jgi:hypothetical protein